MSFMGAVMEGIFTVPGDGSLDFPSLLNRFWNAGYAGWLVVEAEQDPAKAHPLHLLGLATTIFSFGTNRRLRGRDTRGRHAMTSSSAKRPVVLHEDDVGMCHGANAAFLELVRLGVCSSGAVMVPCPWFLEIAEAAAADPALDLGVHLTLNAEKRHYKWRPLTAPSRAVRPDRRSRLLLARRGDDRAAQRAPRRGRGRAARPDRDRLRGRHRRHPSRRAYGRGAGAGILRHLRPARPRIPAADPADLDHRRLYAERQSGRRHRGGAQAAASTRRGQPASRSSTPRCRRPGGGRASKPAEPAYRALVESVREGLTFFCLHFNAPGELELIEPRSAYIRTEEYDAFPQRGFSRLAGWRRTSTSSA